MGEGVRLNLSDFELASNVSSTCEIEKEAEKKQGNLAHAGKKTIKNQLLD